MAIPKDERDELRRLHEAATPGDWEATGWEAGSHGHKHDTCCIAVKGSQTFLTGDIPETPRRRATHKCIAASHNAIPRLLDALDVAEDERGVMRANWARQSAMTDEVRAECDALKAKLAALVDALSKIAHPTYGTEIHDTDSERADIYWQHIERFQRTAQQALVAAQVQP